MYSIAGFTFDKMLHTMPDESWDVIQKVHVRAPFRLIRAAAPYFRIKVSTPVSVNVDFVSPLKCFGWAFECHIPESPVFCFHGLTAVLLDNYRAQSRRTGQSSMFPPSPDCTGMLVRRITQRPRLQ